MKVLQTTTNEVLELASTPFAQGGEGGLYKVVSPIKYQNLVAKIYHPNKRTTQRIHKLRYLIKNPPVFEQVEQASLVSWPIALLEIKQQFVGFLMPKVVGEPLEVLATAKLPKRLPSSWGRFALGEVDALKLRQKVCFNIAVALYHIHQTGHYVMVDFKPDNILIQKNGLVSLVDMDSIEITNGKQVLFPAAMATPEFAPPEFHVLKRNSEAIPTSWDTFSMAIIFYKILLGIHPFAATTKGQYEQATGLGDKLKHGLYVHNKKHEAHFGIVPIPHTAFLKISPPLQYLFNLCFVEGVLSPKSRPTAEDWCLALDNNSKKKKLENRYLIPDDYWQLKELTTPNLRSNLFENSFELVYGKFVKKHLDSIVTTLKKQRQKFRPTWWAFGALFFCFLALILGWFYGWFCLLFLVIGVLFFGVELVQHKQQKKQVLRSFFKVDLEPNLKYLFEQKIEQLFTAHQQRKKAFQQLVAHYQTEVEQLKKDWQQNIHYYEKKCHQYSKEKRDKLFDISQQRNEQALWKQFVGKTAEQKQSYLQQKYLPQKLQQLEIQCKERIEKVDAEHQAVWRLLEKQHYQKIEQINQQNSPQKVAEKETQETYFVTKRQKIIDAIQTQKKAAELYRKTHQELVVSTVKNYCAQLEAIASAAHNKKMAVESSYDLKFEKILDELSKLKKEKNQVMKNEQQRFLIDYQVLVEATLEDLEGLGIERGKVGF